jgi:hypothetical protein
MGKFKMTRIEKPAIRERPIMHQSPPSGPKLSPTSPGASKPSNATAAHAVRIASSPGGIDPRQRHN